ncbi:DUF2884 family protein [Pseudoluteimonas lycopersici]|nr:DUF2884 family protein [Lysobacter lycopersici]
MNKIRTLGCIALLASLAACQGGSPSNSTASGSQKPADKQGGLTGMVGAAMDKARAEMETKNISIGDAFHLNINGHTIRSSDGKAPRAEITPQGDLLIEGKPVDITPVQRTLLLQYRGEIIDVASSGMEIGKQGVDIAGKAVGTAIASIFNGKSDEAEREMKAQGERIEAAAMKLCDQLQPMVKTQQELAASLPAFKPYANLEQSDIDDCRKHDKGDGVAVFSDADREEIRSDIRDGIRESIRGAVRTPSSPGSDDAAAEADAAAAKGG